MSLTEQKKTQPIEISLIYDDEHITTVFSATPDQLNILRDFQENFKPDEDFEFFKINTNICPPPSTKKATEIVNSITEKIGLNKHNQEIWNNIQRMADQIDLNAADETKTWGKQNYNIEFTWNNSEEMFSQKFEGSTTGWKAGLRCPAEAPLIVQFFDALQKAGRDDFYGFEVSTDGTNYDLRDLCYWSAEISDDNPSIKLLHNRLTQVRALQDNAHHRKGLKP